MRGIRVWLVAGLLATGLAAPAMAQRHDRDWGGDRGGDRGRNDRDRGGGGRDVRIEGLSVDRAKDTLRYGGYAHSRNIRLDGKQWDLWISSRNCLGFTSYNGTVTISRRFDERDCAYGVSERRYDDRDGRGYRDGGRFDLRDIVGLSVDEGKRALNYSGYRGARNILVRGQQWDLWSTGGSCVGFTSYRGRITDAQRFPDQQCWR